MITSIHNTLLIRNNEGIISIAMVINTILGIIRLAKYGYMCGGTVLYIIIYYNGFQSLYYIFIYIYCFFRL